MARATRFPEGRGSVAVDLAGRDDVGLADQARLMPAGLDLMAQGRSRQAQSGSGLGHVAVTPYGRVARLSQTGRRLAEGT